MAGMMGRGFVFLSLILASLLQTIQGDTNADDVKGLRLFYSGLNSPPVLTGWNDSEGDPCSDSWMGITCDTDGRYITQIEVSGLMLNGTLNGSSSLDKLQNLRVLDLSNNQLNGVIPYNLPSKIEFLNLQSNQLSKTIPWSLGLLVSLTELRLAHNNLTGPITDIFYMLSSLITLDLSDNNFTGGIPRSLGNLSELSFLYLQGNKMDSGLGVLTKLGLLQTLDIRHNVFHSEEIPSQLWAIPNFQFSADEFPIESSLPLNSFNQPAASPFPGASQSTTPPESYLSPPAPIPYQNSATDGRNSVKSTFWDPERIAGLTVISILAVVASALIFLLFTLRNHDKEFQNANIDISWLGPEPSHPCPRLIKWLSDLQVKVLNSWVRSHL